MSTSIWVPVCSSFVYVPWVTWQICLTFWGSCGIIFYNSHFYYPFINVSWAFFFFAYFLGWLLLLIFKKLFVLFIHFHFFSIVCFSDPSQNSITGEHSQLLGTVFLWGLTLSKVILFLLILREIIPFSNSIFCTPFPLFTPQLLFLLFLFPTW